MDMKYMDRELFKHAVSLLKEYQAQSSADKDNTLIKDAQYVSNFSSFWNLVAYCNSYGAKSEEEWTNKGWSNDGDCYYYDTAI